MQWFPFIALKSFIDAQHSLTVSKSILIISHDKCDDFIKESMVNTNNNHVIIKNHVGKK